MHGKRAIIYGLALLVAVAAAGCGGPKVSPEETVKIYADMAVKYDLSEAQKVGYTEDDVKKAQESKEKNLNNAAKMLFASVRTNPSPAAAEKFKEIVMKIGQRAEIKTELVSKDGQSAIVKISITPLDQAAFMQQTLAPAIRQQLGGPNWASEGADIVVGLYEDAVDAMPLKSAPNSFEVKCVIDEKTNCWRPENVQAFRNQALAANG